MLSSCIYFDFWRAYYEQLNGDAYELLLVGNGNSQCICIPPKVFAKTTINDVKTIFRPWDNAYNTNIFLMKCFPVPGEPYVIIFLYMFDEHDLSHPVTN